MKKYQKILIIAAVIFIFTTVLLYNNYDYIFEIGFVEQPLYNTIHGNFFYSASNGGNHFARHNSPILFLYLPVYYIFEHITSITILTNLLLLLGAIPIYLFGKKVGMKITDNKKLSELSGIIIMTSYILFPSFLYSNLRSFHPVMLAAPLISWGLYFLFEKKHQLALTFFLLAMLTNETVSLLMIFLGIYIAFKHEKKTGVYLIILALVWFQFSTSIISSANGSGEYPYFKEIYGHLGTDFSSVIKTIITNPVSSFMYGKPVRKIVYLLEIFGHNIFLGFLSPWLILTTLPVLAQNLFSSSPYKYDILAHYVYPIVPIIFFSLMGGLIRIKRNEKKNIIFSYIKNNYKTILYILLVIAIYNGFFNGAINIYKDNCSTFGSNCQTGDIIVNTPRESVPIISKFIKMIPEDATVLAQDHIYSSVSNRKIALLFQRYNSPPTTDYILLDRDGNYAPVNFDEYLQYLKENKNYNLLAHEGNIYLYKAIAKRE